MWYHDIVYNISGNTEVSINNCNTNNYIVKLSNKKGTRKDNNQLNYPLPFKIIYPITIIQIMKKMLYSYDNWKG